MLRNARTPVNSRAGLRIPVLVFAVLVTAFVIAVPVHAQVQSLQQTAAAAGVGGSTDLVTIIGRLINIVLGFLGILLLILLLFAGYLWMTSGGDPEKVKKAQDYIRNAIIGLVIIASAWAITAFILGFFAGEMGGSGGVSGGTKGFGGFTSGSGALGGGIIESHYPPRNATNVARNTKIIITFKKPIKLSSIIAGYNDNGTPAILSDDATSTDGLNDAAIKIFPTGKGVAGALNSAAVRVKFTSDRKTFVFSKVGCQSPNWDCFGSPTTNMGYSVELMGGKTGILLENNDPAFGGLSGCPNQGAYCWNFETGKELDLTPPRILSVIPQAGNQYARNIVVQVVFSEAIDPSSATGYVSNGEGFQNIQTHANGVDTALVDGEYRISNQYRTIEFIPGDLCGKNSCGRDVFCLPGGTSIDELVTAASLDGEGPMAQFTSIGYDGIVDVCGNSLDGNDNGKAEGFGKDDFAWRFGTSNDVNLEAPVIETTQPPSDPQDPGKSNIDPFAPVGVRFDSMLQSSSFNTDSASIKTKEPAELDDTFWWQAAVQMLTDKNEPVTKVADIPYKSLGILDHRMYASSTEYDPFMRSGIQNVYQNCFNPASSRECLSDKAHPNCCDNKPGTQECAF
jgi:hypothetical protein